MAKLLNRSSWLLREGCHIELLFCVRQGLDLPVEKKTSQRWGVGLWLADLSVAVTSLLF